MKIYPESHIKNFVGEDICVTVYFDYTPKEKANSTYPGCNSKVIINGIYIDDTGKDVSSIIDKSIIEDLTIQCYEYWESCE